MTRIPAEQDSFRGMRVLPYGNSCCPGYSFAIVVALAFLCCARQVEAQPQAESPWWQRSVERKLGPYFIKSDLPPAEVNTLARHLNLMHGEYSHRLASLPPRVAQPMNVLIFKRQREYLDVLRTRFGVNAVGSSGMFFSNPSGQSLAIWTEHLTERRIHHVLQHEGFHQFAWSRFGSDLPMWVNEGLAEFFGESVLVNGKLVLGQSNPRVIESVMNAIELGEHIPFRRMLMMQSSQWNDALRTGNASSQYNQAWSMVHFLVYGDEGRYTTRFEAYLRLINKGHQSENAFVRAFETDDIDAFERAWKEYALQAKPSAFVTALERIEFLAAGALELSHQGLAPETLETLRESLVEIDFRYMTQTHGIGVQFNAENDELFNIPMDHLSEEQPIFTLRKSRPRRSSPRDRQWEEQSPMPAIIETENLSPKTLAVYWYRDRETGILRYEIAVK